MFKVKKLQTKLPSLAFLLLLAYFFSQLNGQQVIEMAEWGEIDQTIFEQQYPRDPQGKPQAKSPQVCSVRDNQYFAPSHPKCRRSLNVCQQTLHQITRINRLTGSLLPGTIVQLFQHKAIPIELVNYAKPLSIVLSNGFEAHFKEVTSPKEWKGQMDGFLTKFEQDLNQRKIEIKVVQPARIKKALQALGLSTAIYEHLQIASSNLYSLKYSKRIMAVFHQKFFTATLKLPTNVNIIQHLLGESDRLENQPLLHLIYNPDNPLNFISRAHYGRLLLISVESNVKTEQDMVKLMECTINGTFLTNCLADVMKTVLRDPTLRYYFAGINDSMPFQQPCEYCKPSILWQRIFFPINTSTVGALRPMSAEIMSFTGQPYHQDIIRFFETEDCTKQIAVNITKIGKNNLLSLRVFNNIFPANRSTIRPVRHLFNTTHPGTFQIGSEVGKEVFELKFLAKGRRVQNGLKFFFLKKVPIYSIQVEFALLINGEKKIEHVIGKSRSHQQFSEVTIRVDPQTQSGSILFMDIKEIDEPEQSLRSFAPEIDNYPQ